MKTDQELISLLHSRGLKVTPQRLAIYKYIIDSNVHPSADLIFDDIKSILPTISQGTVYKTLGMLVDIGVIQELTFANSHTRYDNNIKNHINIICNSCGDIIDFESDNLTRLNRLLLEEIGGEITAQRFDVYRDCEKCN